MPSLVLGNPRASGPNQVLTGNPWSGRLPPMAGGIQVFWVSSGGNAYIGFSGNMTINSGTLLISGGATSGMTDGMCLTPGMGYWIDRTQVPLVGATSGNFNLYADCDQSASGVGRLYFDVR